MKIHENILKMKNEIIEIRRDLHRIPEAGFAEYKTSEYIKNYLTAFGISFEEVAQTGIVGFVKGSVGEKTIAFRADMDALSMTELTELEFCSEHEGFMHGCGHDGHMAMLLGLAKYLSENQGQLLDNVLLIFQPAEEGPGGAEVIIKEGIFDKYKVDEIYGIHLYPEVYQGKIAIKEGPLMAMTGEFDIVIKGEGGHGAIPHKALDAVIIAAEFISQVQTIISRNINPIDPAVLTIGRMEAGERRNIIAEKAVLEGTLRAFSENVYNKVKERVYDFKKGFELSYGCTIEVEFRDMYPPVYNDSRLVQRIIENDKECTYELIEPQMISEDFSYYQKSAPGVFMFLGTKNPEKNFVFPLHNSKFNFDEEVLLLGIQSYVRILENNGSFE